MTSVDGGTDLYRFYDSSGRLLYVGISFHAVARASQHRREKNWWPQVARMDVEHLPTRSAAVAAELHAIRTEHPAHNVIGARPRQPECRRVKVGNNYIIIQRGTHKYEPRMNAHFIDVACTCGSKHRHGLTSVEGARGWMHRMPHCNQINRRSFWQVVRFSPLDSGIIAELDRFERAPIAYDTVEQFLRDRDRVHFNRWRMAAT